MKGAGRVKKFPIRITLVPKGQFKEVERLDRLATEIQKKSVWVLPGGTTVPV